MARLQLGGPDPDWIDTFMRKILERDYDAARETLRSAVARGVNSSIAEQYAKVLEDFLRRRDEMENPVILGCFGQCELRQADDKTGRGLFVPAYCSGSTELWNQRPLMYIQSPCSRRC